MRPRRGAWAYTSASHELSGTRFGVKANFPFGPFRPQDPPAALDFFLPPIVFYNGHIRASEKAAVFYYLSVVGRSSNDLCG